jgi:hypothetical protein
MGKFLVINRTPTHQTKRGAVGKCVSHFVNMDTMGKARVYPIAGLKGYATLVDVKDHEELKGVLSGNAMGNIEKYTVIALADLKD